MEQAHRIDLLDELSETAPEGLEGMASMICTHLNNAVKFNDEKVNKFELATLLLFKDVLPVFDFLLFIHNYLMLICSDNYAQA